MSEAIEELTAHRPDVEVQPDRETGFSIRHVPESEHPFLKWQAGRIVSERRQYVGPGMDAFGFLGTVSLFRLLGFGATRDEAITNAQRNPQGRNGR